MRHLYKQVLLLSRLGVTVGFASVDMKLKERSFLDQVVHLGLARMTSSAVIHFPKGTNHMHGEGLYP